MFLAIRPNPTSAARTKQSERKSPRLYSAGVIERHKTRQTRNAVVELSYQRRILEAVCVWEVSLHGQHDTFSGQRDILWGRHDTLSNEHPDAAIHVLDAAA